jgi:hypothetical protein
MIVAQIGPVKEHNIAQIIKITIAAIITILSPKSKNEKDYADYYSQFKGMADCTSY